MKKNFILIAALLAFVVILPSTLKARPQESTTRWVTIYYCDPGEPRCLTWYNGNMSVSITGILHVKTIRMAAVYAPPPSGYTEYNHYFCHDPNNDNIGKGVIEGFLHYRDNNSDFYAYECQGSTIYTNFNQWQNALP